MKLSSAIVLSGTVFTLMVVSLAGAYVYDLNNARLQASTLSGGSTSAEPVKKNDVKMAIGTRIRVNINVNTSLSRNPIYLRLTSAPANEPPNDNGSTKEGEIALERYDQDVAPQKKAKVDATLPYRVEVSPQVSKAIDAYNVIYILTHRRELKYKKDWQPLKIKDFLSGDNLDFVLENQATDASPDLGNQLYEKIGSFSAAFSNPFGQKIALATITGGGIKKLLPDKVVATMDPSLLAKIKLTTGTIPFYPPQSTDPALQEKLLIQIETNFNPKLTPSDLVQLFVKFKYYSQMKTRLTQARAFGPKSTQYTAAKNDYINARQEFMTEFNKDLESLTITFTPASAPPAAPTLPAVGTVPAK